LGIHPSWVVLSACPALFQARTGPAAIDARLARQSWR